MTKAEEIAIIVELTGCHFDSEGFNKVWDNEAAKSAFIEVWTERQKRSNDRDKQILEGLQFIYNILDQYATLDLARDGNSRYPSFEKKTLAQALKRSMIDNKDKREEQFQQAMALAGIFNNRRKDKDG